MGALFAQLIRLLASAVSVKHKIMPGPGLDGARMAKAEAVRVPASKQPGRMPA